ncbi:hypothetical protein FALBO_134 [Fusarium albosuccineum]|uniref:Uncharacterized protein n=1 Tax=Fusarium albosuccineum TaxID=1237068 RepID=A0A8H4LP63_9HYPO|nr:hypothetical protein FALBO_134 [Fusarium albosuccineum]
MAPSSIDSAPADHTRYLGPTSHAFAVGRVSHEGGPGTFLETDEPPMDDIPSIYGTQPALFQPRKSWDHWHGRDHIYPATFDSYQVIISKMSDGRARPEYLAAGFDMAWPEDAEDLWHLHQQITGKQGLHDAGLHGLLRMLTYGLNDVVSVARGDLTIWRRQIRENRGAPEPLSSPFLTDTYDTVSCSRSMGFETAEAWRKEMCGRRWSEGPAAARRRRLPRGSWMGRVALRVRFLWYSALAAAFQSGRWSPEHLLPVHYPSRPCRGRVRQTGQHLPPELLTVDGCWREPQQAFNLLIRDWVMDPWIRGTDGSINYVRAAINVKALYQRVILEEMGIMGGLFKARAGTGEQAVKYTRHGPNSRLVASMSHAVSLARHQQRPIIYRLRWLHAVLLALCRDGPSLVPSPSAPVPRTRRRPIPVNGPGLDQAPIYVPAAHRPSDQLVHREGCGGAWLLFPRLGPRHCDHAVGGGGGAGRRVVRGHDRGGDHRLRRLDRCRHARCIRSHAIEDASEIDCRDAAELDDGDDGYVGGGAEQMSVVPRDELGLARVPDRVTYRLSTGNFITHVPAGLIADSQWDTILAAAAAPFIAPPDRKLSTEDQNTARDERQKRRRVQEGRSAVDGWRGGGVYGLIRWFPCMSSRLAGLPHG